MARVHLVDIPRRLQNKLRVGEFESIFEVSCLWHTLRMGENPGQRGSLVNVDL